VRNRIARTLTGIWYSSAAPPGLLRAASALYARAVRGRLVRPCAKPPCPVIVVGNLVAGGSGKTPVVAALVDSLAEAGYAVSIISRGYGGRTGPRPVRVESGSSAIEVGDEALELHSRTGRPVWVCRKRDSALEARWPTARRSWCRMTGCSTWHCRAASRSALSTPVAGSEMALFSLPVHCVSRQTGSKRSTWC